MRGGKLWGGFFNLPSHLGIGSLKRTPQLFCLSLTASHHRNSERWIAHFQEILFTSGVDLANLFGLHADWQRKLG